MILDAEYPVCRSITNAPFYDKQAFIFLLVCQKREHIMVCSAAVFFIYEFYKIE